MNPARRDPMLVLAACIVALGSVLIAQFGFGLRPCHLCTLQRLPWGAALPFALLALVERVDARFRALLLALCAVAFLVGAGLAFYHVGVEHRWWESSCSGGGGLANSASSLLARLQSGPAAVPCDSVSFALFGLSFAAMNLIASLVLAGFAARAARRAWSEA